jgi:hypothetical protein
MMKVVRRERKEMKRKIEEQEGADNEGGEEAEEE